MGVKIWHRHISFFANMENTEEIKKKIVQQMKNKPISLT